MERSQPFSFEVRKQHLVEALHNLASLTTHQLRSLSPTGTGDQTLALDDEANVLLSMSFLYGAIKEHLTDLIKELSEMEWKEFSHRFGVWYDVELEAIQLILPSSTWNKSSKRQGRIAGIIALMMDPPSTREEILLATTRFLQTSSSELTAIVPAPETLPANATSSLPDEARPDISPPNTEIRGHDGVVTLGDEVDAFIGGDDFYLAPDFGDAGGEEIGVIRSPQENLQRPTTERSSDTSSHINTSHVVVASVAPTAAAISVDYPDDNSDTPKKAAEQSISTPNIVATHLPTNSNEQLSTEHEENARSEPTDKDQTDPSVGCTYCIRNSLVCSGTTSVTAWTPTPCSACRQKKFRCRWEVLDKRIKARSEAYSLAIITLKRLIVNLEESGEPAKDQRHALVRLLDYGLLQQITLTELGKTDDQISRQCVDEGQEQEGSGDLSITSTGTERPNDTSSRQEVREKAIEVIRKCIDTLRLPASDLTLGQGGVDKEML